MYAFKVTSKITKEDGAVVSPPELSQLDGKFYVAVMWDKDNSFTTTCVDEIHAEVIKEEMPGNPFTIIDGGKDPVH
jgi:hypothetical protein